MANIHKRVTWLIPVLNGMPYISETLASIEAQTYQNWEVLVWDNGSTDGTLEELEKWIPTRLPGRIITGEPLSVGDSLARMVEECKTELCARIDADDINLPERLEKQVAFLSSHPEVAVVGSQMHRLDSQGIIHEPMNDVPLHHDEIVHKMLRFNSISGPSVLFRRSAILRAGNYRHLKSWSGVNIEDYDLWLRVGAFYKLANLNDSLVNYRIHDRSTTQISIRENRFYTALDNCICENSHILFGCTSDEMKLLRNKQHPFAIRPLYKIAKHLHKTQGGELLNILRSDSFTQSAKGLIHPKDVISRLAIAILRRQPLALPQEILSIGLDMTNTKSLALELLRATQKS